MSCSIILSGGVAKGSAQAGMISILLDYLAKNNKKVTTIIGASAGSLNGVALSAGLHAGSKTIGEDICNFWINKADVYNFASFNLLNFLSGKGLASLDKGMTLIEGFLNKYAGKGSNPINFGAVLTVLNGVPDPISGGKNCEYLYKFTGKDFDVNNKQLARVACASGAFPVVFEPVSVSLPNAPNSLIIDGGVCNNSPISYCSDDPEVDEVYVLTPEKTIPEYDGAGGLSLIYQMIDIMIGNRRDTDIANALKINIKLDNLSNLGLSDDELTKVKDAVGLTSKRKLKITQIYCETNLPGNSFAGFFDKSLRQEYVARGKDAAKKVLGM